MEASRGLLVGLHANLSREEHGPARSASRYTGWHGQQELPREPELLDAHAPFHEDPG
jgi:hypothetical protein